MTPRDTTPEARAMQVAVWRRLGGPARVELAMEMSDAAREIAIEGEMARAPSLSRDAARRRVLRRILGAEVFDAAYGREA
jgi:hypothetical protein